MIVSRKCFKYVLQNVKISLSFVKIFSTSYFFFKHVFYSSILSIFVRSKDDDDDDDEDDDDGANAFHRKNRVLLNAEQI